MKRKRTIYALKKMDANGKAYTVSTSHSRMALESDAATMNVKQDKYRYFVVVM